jgi:hypothetical protein
MVVVEELPTDPAEIARLQAEALDALRFPNYVKHLRIDDRRTGQQVPLLLNPVQLKLREREDSLRHLGLTVST